MANIQDLPDEILEIIFQHYMRKSSPKIRPNATKCLSLVCHRWLRINHKFYQKYCVVLFDKKSITRNPSLAFENSFRHFYNIKFTDIDLRKENIRKNILNFLKLRNINETIRSIKFSGGSISFDILCEIISHLENLEEISLMFMNLDEYLQKDKLKNISKIISQLKRFEFNCYVTKTTLKHIVAILSHTKNLEKFFIDIIENEDIINECVREVLHTTITNNASKLKDFHVVEFHGNSEEIFLILKLLPLLKIKNLAIQLSGRRNILSIDSSCAYIRMNCPSIDENVFGIEILGIFNDLTSLVLCYWEITNTVLSTITKYTKLTTLELECCKCNFTINKNILNIENLKITNLDKRISDHYEPFINYPQHTPKLETFFIYTNSSKFLSKELSEPDRYNIIERGLQSIIKNCTKLEELSLKHYITDYAITGFNKERKVQDGYSIKNLKKLETLELYAYNLTEQSLWNLEFPELEVLVLYNKDIQNDIFTHIIKNCPKLKLLKLSIYFDYKNYNSIEEINKIINYQRKLIRNKRIHCYSIRNKTILKLDNDSNDAKRMKME